jgi:hypothetical protein
VAAVVLGWVKNVLLLAIYQNGNQQISIGWKLPGDR